MSTLLNTGTLKNTPSLSVVSQASNLPFYLTILYLLLEFGRPQESVPGLGALHIPAIVTVLLAISLLVSGRVSFSDKQTKLFIALLFLMALHIPTAQNNYWAFHIAKAMAQNFVVYLGIVNYMDSYQKFKTLIYAWLGIHIYLAIAGIMKKGRGIGGFLGDENDFCMTLNMIIPISFFLAVSEKNKFRKAVYLGLTMLFLFANVATLSRGGFIGLMGVGIYCWLRSSKKIASAIVIGLLALFVVQYAPDEYWSEISSIQEEGASQGTGGERVYQWKIGWAMFLDNPVLGVGQGNFPNRFREYEIEKGFYEGLKGRSRAGRAAHSLYFTLFPELGTIGTLIFFGMVYYVYKDARLIRRARAAKPARVSGQEADQMVHLSRAMEGSMVGYLVSGVFISILYYPNLWILTGFVVALRKLAEKEYENSSSSD